MSQPKSGPGSRGLNLAAISLGLASGLLQVILLRELMVLAGGNEFSLGLGLACWLLWTAAGSLLLGRGRRRPGGNGAGLALLLVGLAGLVSLGLSRLAPAWLGLPLGVVPSLGQALGLSLLLLAPAGLAAGAGYPLILASVPPDQPAPPRTLARLYGLEALGATAAGALFALVLVRLLGPLALAGLAAAQAALTALALLAGRARWATAAWLLVLAGLLAGSGPLEAALAQWQWRGRQMVGWVESPYARLTATKRQGQTDFFASGLWLFSYPDPERTERTALLPLLARPGAASALFIGGGASGAAGLAARRGGLSRVVALELDPWLVQMAQGFTGGQAGGALSLALGDGRVFLERTEQRFDLVVCDLPPPVTVQLARFYSQEGMAALARVLEPGGVAVLSLPGMESLVGRLQAQRLGTVLAAARAVFGQVLIMSGLELRLLLSPRPGSLPSKPGPWLERLERRGWPEVVGVRPDTILSELDPWRLAQLEAAVSQAGAQPANRDLTPRVLLLDPQLWGTYLGGAGRAAQVLSGLRAGHLAWPLIILAGLLLLATARGWLGGLVLPLAVWVTGLTSMALSMLLLTAYQVLFGAVYVGLALVMAGFMLGLAGAALLAAPRLARLGRPRRVLGLLSALTAVACLLTQGAVLWLHQAQAGPYWAWLLIGLAALDGGLTGAYFALAGRLRLDQEPGRLAPLGARLYGLDLAGGMVGALLPVLLIPTMGLASALLVLACLNLVPLGGLLGMGLSGRS